MTPKPIMAVALGLLFGAGTAARAADLKLEAQLIWATSEARSPNPRHRPVDADVQKKLAGLPLKWTHFFEENRRLLHVREGATQRAELSDRSMVAVKQLPSEKVEVTLYGNGREVWKGVQPLPKGEILVLGGNAPADSAWLVTLKRVE